MPSGGDSAVWWTNAAVRERALRLFADHRQDYPSDTALAEAVAKKVPVGRETARRWLVQADVNAEVRASKIPAEAACAVRGTRGPDHAEPVRRRFCRAASVCPNVIDVDRAVLRTCAPRYSHATKAAARSFRSRTSRTLAARGKSPRLGSRDAVTHDPIRLPTEHPHPHRPSINHYRPRRGERVWRVAPFRDPCRVGRDRRSRRPPREAGFGLPAAAAAPSSLSHW
jgi:hypothetical protein